MIWVWYNVLFGVAFFFLLPRFIFRMLKRGGYGASFLNRFGVYGEVILGQLKGGGRVWVHAVSVGEMGVCLQCIDEWRRQDAGVRFVVSVTTSTGYEVARRGLHEEDVLIYFPVDFPWVLRRVIGLLEPRMLVIVETELWPNLIRMLHGRGVPVVLLNGRISDRSYPRYRKVRAFTGRLLPMMDCFLMQSDVDAERVVDLGARPETVEVLASLKYDPLSDDVVGEADIVAWLRQAGVEEGDRIVLGASTWAGEERLLAKEYLRLREEYVDLKLVLVPRHAERRREVVRDLEGLGLSVELRSMMSDVSRKADVLVVDTTGELRALYAHAALVFVGKTLCAEGGQNMIEPAYFGCPIVLGPHVQNFRSTVDELLAADAVVMVEDEAALKEAMLRLLSDSVELKRLGEAAARVIAGKRGGTAQAVERLRLY